MKLWTEIILLAILLVGAGLRWHHIGQASYWYDEFGSLETSAGHGLEHLDLPRQEILRSPPDLLSLTSARPLWHIWISMGQDFHPPLYFMLLRIWREFFGSTETATRSLSALAGVLSIICIYDVGRLAHGARAGLWAAAIFAVAGPQVEYSHEARGYTLVVFFGLCVLDAIVRIERMGINRRRLFALAVGLLAMMLTHYVGIPVAVALAAYLFVRSPAGIKRKMFAAMIAAGIIYAAAWGPFMLAQRHSAAMVESDLLTQGLWSRWYVPEHLAALPIQLLGTVTQKNIASAWPAAIIYILPLLMLRRNPFLLLWLFWLAGAAGLFALMDEMHPMHHLSYARYVLMCGPGFYLLMAGLLADRKGILPHLLPAAAILFCLVSLRATLAEEPRPDWRAISAAIDKMKIPGDVLVFASDGKADWYSGLYVDYAFYSAQKPRNVLMLVCPADAKLLKEMNRFSGAVLTNGNHLAPSELLGGYRIVQTANFLPFVNIYRMQGNR